MWDPTADPVHWIALEGVLPSDRCAQGKHNARVTTMATPVRTPVSSRGPHQVQPSTFFKFISSHGLPESFERQFKALKRFQSTKKDSESTQHPTKPKHPSQDLLNPFKSFQGHQSLPTSEQCDVQQRTLVVPSGSGDIHHERCHGNGDDSMR